MVRRPRSFKSWAEFRRIEVAPRPLLPDIDESKVVEAIEEIEAQEEE